MNQKYVERLFKGLHFTFRIIEKLQSKKKIQNVLFRTSFIYFKKTHDLLAENMNLKIKLQVEKKLFSCCIL